MKGTHTGQGNVRLGSHLYSNLRKRAIITLIRFLLPLVLHFSRSINLNEEIYCEDEVRIAESSIPSNRGTNGFMCLLNYYGSGHKSEYSRKTVPLSKTALVRAN